MTELDSEVYYVPLKTQIAAYWPQDIVPLPTLDALDKVWIVPSLFIDDEQSEKLIYETTLLFEQALHIDFGFVAGLSLILGTADLTTPVPLSVTISDITVPDPEPYVIQVGPVPITLLVASDLLKRMEITALPRCSNSGRHTRATSRPRTVWAGWSLCLQHDARLSRPHRLRE